jgi:hypothetical protein
MSNLHYFNNKIYLFFVFLNISLSDITLKVMPARFAHAFAACHFAILTATAA